MTENKTCPALSEAFEHRRSQLGLTIQEVADQTGLTRQGLAPIRRGEVRQYNDRTIFGLRSVFGWRADWYDVVKKGGTPDELLAAEPTASEDAPSWALQLLDEQRQITRALERLADQLESGERAQS